MLLVSHNLSRYDSIPDYAVIRINLAWINTIDILKKAVEHFDNSIFLDMPIGSTKPPNDSYSIEQIKDFVLSYDNIDYLAVSNVESSDDIVSYVNYFKDMLKIVPKIESKKGIDNFQDILTVLGTEPYVMLDHDDLFLDLSRNKVPPSEFLFYIAKLRNLCSKNSVNLLKTRGVIFSDKD